MKYEEQILKKRITIGKTMENKTLNKNEREIKNENLEWKMNLLEVAKTCIKSYQITQNIEFINIAKSLMEEANFWEREAQSRKTL